MYSTAVVLIGGVVGERVLSAEHFGIVLVWGFESKVRIGARA